MARKSSKTTTTTEAPATVVSRDGKIAQALNAAGVPTGKPIARKAAKKAAKAKAPKKAAKKAAKKNGAAPAQRAGTKQAKMIALISRPQGATNEEIQKATGWQPHTVRGAIAGALKKKLGLKVIAEDGEKGRTYRIA